MANHEILEPKAFNAELRMFETTDRGNANIFNPVDAQLINNDVYLKEQTDAISLRIDNIDEELQNTDIDCGSFADPAVTPVVM